MNVPTIQELFFCQIIIVVKFSNEQYNNCRTLRFQNVSAFYSFDVVPFFDFILMLIAVLDNCFVCPYTFCTVHIYLYSLYKMWNIKTFKTIVSVQPLYMPSFLAIHIALNVNYAYIMLCVQFYVLWTCTFHHIVCAQCTK